MLSVSCYQLNKIVSLIALFFYGLLLTSTTIPCLCLCLSLSLFLLPQLQLEKQKGEILGIVIVESGWGSILPTVILANMMNGGPAARSGKLSIGDQIMSINNTSLVGLPLATCQGIIKVCTRVGLSQCAVG